MIPTKFQFIWLSGFRGEICLEINQSKTRIVCGNCLLTDRDEMSNLYTGPSTDASYQVSEEKIKMWKVNGRRTSSDGKSSRCLWQGSSKLCVWYVFLSSHISEIVRATTASFIACLIMNFYLLTKITFFQVFHCIWFLFNN
jgi:hypothetical protein